MAHARPEHPPAGFVAVVRATDPTHDGKSIRIAHDILERTGGLAHGELLEAKAYIDALLTSAAISNADLKGLLNRSAGPIWATAFEFGADAKAARLYLDALSQAIARDVE